MTGKMKTHRIITAILLLQCLLAQGAPRPYNSDSLRQIRKNRAYRIKGGVEIADLHTPVAEIDKYLSIPDFHPAADRQDSLPDVLRAQVLKRARTLSKDSLSGPELFWSLRPFLLWAQRLDPHFRAEPNPVSIAAGSDLNRIPVPGFRMLRVDDTLIVERTLDSNLKRGDRIISINGTSASEYLQYCYPDRHLYPFTLLANYHYRIVSASDYTIRVERNGEQINVSCTAMPWEDVYMGLLGQQEFRSSIFPDAQAGYFAIEEFYPDNTRLIKKLRKSILNAQKQGCDSFILDLRGNPGGYGANFDRLLSLFVDKESIPYLRRQYLQVSNQTVNDYDFLTEASIGRKVALPEGTYPQEIKPDRSCFIPDMRYYVLMDKDTGSIAASLCNILQYNGAAQLVGEPLERNALKYGETIDAWLYLSPLLLSCSTMEYDEYTRAENGVLMPDIAIPYVAQEYLAGRDGMLEKLLELLKTNRQNGQATANLRTNPSNLNQ